MQLSFDETKARIEECRTLLSTATGKERRDLSQELMKHSRNISKYPEYKELKNAKK